MKNRLGLALSGGGVRGLAHIGVLKVLEREGIAIEAMAGASMGGLIAAIYAAGYPAGEIERMALDLSRPRRLLHLVDFSPLRRGLVETDKVRQLLLEIFNVCGTFADLSLPVALTAVDIRRGREVVLREGPLIEAVMATISVPGLFPPVKWEGCELVDGGVLNNLPTDAARSPGVGVVAAVDVAPDYSGDLQPESWPSFLPPVGQHLYAAEAAMVSEITRYRLQEFPPDILIRPCLPASVSVFWGFHDAKEAIASGELAAQEAVGAIRSLLAGSPAAE